MAVTGAIVDERLQEQTDSAVSTQKVSRIKENIISMRVSEAFSSDMATEVIGNANQSIHYKTITN